MPKHAKDSKNSEDSEDSQDSNDESRTAGGVGQGGFPDLATLLAFLSQFKETQQHLMQAGLELVSACRTALESILEVLEKEQPQLRQKWEFLYLLQYGLGFVATRMNSNGTRAKRSQEEKNEHKLAALESIIEVLEKEMEKLTQGINKESPRSRGGSQERHADERQIQLGAMLAIKNVLEREMAQARHAGKKKHAAKAPPPRAEASKSRKRPKRDAVRFDD